MNIATKDINFLLPDPPFCVGIPERVIFYNKNEALNFINLWNGKKRIFLSLYSLRYFYLDKIWFDLDSINSYKNAIIFHEWCKSNNYMHSIMMSGAGFHIILYTKNYKDILEPKIALKIIHQDIANKLSLRIGDPNVCDIDDHIIGDIQRIYGLPGTYNSKRRRWVTSLTPEELYKGLDYIDELSKQQRNEIYVIGDEYYDISNYHNARIEYEDVDIPTLKDIIIPEDDKEILSMFPPCVQSVLLDINRNGHYKGRYLYTLWAYELGLSKEQCDNIAKRFFSRVQRTDSLKNNYEQYRRVKTIDYVYKRNDILPSCEKVLVDYNLCQGRCKWYLKK